MTAQPETPASTPETPTPGAETPQTPTPTPQPPQTTPGTPQEPQKGTEGQPTWNPDAWDGKVETLPADAQRMIRDLRKAEGDERVARKTLDAIMAAINPESTEDPDPQKLAADLQSKDQQIRDLTIKSALSDALSTAGAKPLARAAILGDGVLKDLDPSADDFGTKVEDAVKAYIEKYPELKAGRAPGSSSVDHAGGSGEGAITKEKFDAMSYEDQVELFQQNPTLYRQMSGG